MNADKLKKPILLVHGEADNNPGTLTMQSERLYSALTGHGAECKLVILPHEAHGYRGVFCGADRARLETCGMLRKDARVRAVVVGVSRGGSSSAFTVADTCCGLARPSLRFIKPHP